MAKADLVLPDGTRVRIEGSAEEVAVLLTKFSQPATAPPIPAQVKEKRKLKKDKGGTARQKKKGPAGLIRELADEDYFKSRRGLSDIQRKLEQRGHIYAQHSLSPALLRLTQSKALRRIKEKKGWVYVS